MTRIWHCNLKPTLEDLQVCNISTQQTMEEMNTKVVAEVEVDIAEEGDSRVISYRNY